jgi:uncharacterized membrane-anchored protein
LKQADVDYLLAWAQIGLAFLFAICIFALVFVLIFFNASISATALTIITTVITALVTILTLIANFFYARTRPAALPDPSTTTTSTTTTTTPAPVIVPAGSIIAPGVSHATTSTAAQVAAALKPPG